MRIDKAFMSGKVSRRISALFVLAAFIPLLVITVLTYSQVSSLVAGQARPAGLPTLDFQQENAAVGYII